jgi:hypothetical protein
MSKVGETVSSRIAEGAAKSKKVVKEVVDSFIGDALNIFIILNASVFMYLVIAQHDGKIDIFSPSFVRDGFCVSN